MWHFATVDKQSDIHSVLQAPLAGIPRLQAKLYHSLFRLSAEQMSDREIIKSMHEGHGWCACREERDKVEREAKEKEWAAQEAERSGEWYYKEVRRLFRHNMSDQHTHKGLEMLQRCSHPLEAPRSGGCILYTEAIPPITSSS